MERARDEVARILHEHGGSTVAELASAIGVSAGSVRRHLDIMVADGLLQTQRERRPRGRPVIRYSLSEAGEEQSPASHYSKLIDRLPPALSSLPAEEVSGRSGAEILERVFEQVAEVVADEYRTRVRAETLGERVSQVALALREEGILDNVIEADDEYRLLNVGCPYRSTAEATHAVCHADRRTIELLVGAPVEQVSTVVQGGSCCEYVVRKGQPAGVTTGQGTSEQRGWERRAL